MLDRVIMPQIKAFFQVSMCIKCMISVEFFWLIYFWRCSTSFNYVARISFKQFIEFPHGQTPKTIDATLSSSPPFTHVKLSKLTTTKTA